MIDLVPDLRPSFYSLKRETFSSTTKILITGNHDPARFYSLKRETFSSTAQFHRRR